MSNLPPSNDLLHDERLRTALRHAPDHSLTPPSGVNQAILEAARQVHNPAKPTVAPALANTPIPRQRDWRALFQFVATPRWAGALSAGLVGALVLGLWVDNELPPALSPTLDPAAAVARHPAQAPSGDSVAAGPGPASPVPGATPSDAIPSGSTPPGTTPPAAAAPPAAATTTAEAVAQAPTVAPQSESKAAATQALVIPAPENRAIAQAPTQRDDSKAMPGPATTPARARNEPSKRSDPAAKNLGFAQAPAAAVERGKAAKSTTSEAGLSAPPAAAPTPAERANAGPTAAGPAAAAASPALTLLRRVRADAVAQGVVWTWQAPGRTSVSEFDAAGQVWLQTLVHSARGRWSDVAEPGSQAVDGIELRWWRDGQLHARLRIEAQGLRWLEPSGRIRYAPLDAAALQELRRY